MPRVVPLVQGSPDKPLRPQARRHTAFPGKDLREVQGRLPEVAGLVERFPQRPACPRAWCWRPVRKAELLLEGFLFTAACRSGHGSRVGGTWDWR